MCVCSHTETRLVHGFAQPAEARMCTLGDSYWCTSVSVCLLFSYSFFFCCIFHRSNSGFLLSAHHPLVLPVLLVYGNRFLCLICSLVWSSSCSLFQCTMCYCIQGFSSPCARLRLYGCFQERGEQRGNQTHFNCLLEKSLHSQAVSLKAKGLLRLWNSWTFAQHGWARA